MGGARILVVEDDELIAKELSLLLESAGYQVPPPLRSGEAAIRYCRESPPDLVLMDIILDSSLDGVEAAAQIAKTQPLPIIFLTAYDDDATLQRARITEPSAYLLKPVSLRDLQICIDLALHKHELTRQRSARADLELQLLRWEKAATLSNIATSLAHEASTPLGIAVTALTHIESLLTELEGHFHQLHVTQGEMQRFIHDGFEGLELVHNNLQRAVQLIDSFRHLAVDQQTDQPRSFDLVEYLEEVLFALRPRLRQHAYAVHISGPEALPLTSYPGALSQIIINLVLNSIQHGFGQRDQGQIRIEASQPEARQVQIDYRDNGCGMPPEVLRSFTTPFFTTADAPQRTGLGGSIIKALTRSPLQGDLQAWSRPGEGVHFRIKFPRHANKSPKIVRE